MFAGLSDYWLLCSSTINEVLLVLGPPWFEWDVLSCAPIGGGWMANAGAPLEWEMSREKTSRATDAHTAGCQTQHWRTHGVFSRIKKDVCIFWGGIYAFPSSWSPGFGSLVRAFLNRASFFAHHQLWALSMGALSSSVLPRRKSSVSGWSGYWRSLSPEIVVVFLFPETPEMDQQLSKPEPRSMDACLRRLKQELVGPVYRHFCS